MAIESYTGMHEGGGGNGDYQGAGVGNTTQSYREATRKGKFPVDNTGPNRSTGETPGAGTIYAATLVERPNISNNRNQGPTRSPSRSAATPIPVTTMASRATGRVNAE